MREQCIARTDERQALWRAARQRRLRQIALDLLSRGSPQSLVVMDWLARWHCCLLEVGNELAHAAELLSPDSIPSCLLPSQSRLVTVSTSLPGII